MKSICAKCGETNELCDSVTIDSIKQPRFCKDCLIKTLKTGEDLIAVDEYYIFQLVALGELESLRILAERESCK